ncbi:MAG TPA: flagellar biosynthesis protein FlgB [Terriglobales bacterium]|jgi:flagellar basal-body rod protein FlgB|nr:flagellar biosynthesis protein FlgB [Terriglobales bacterium]
MNDISTPMMNLLEKFLDVTTQRHKLVVSNMANIDTPGYQTKDIDFRGELQRAVFNGNAPLSPVVRSVPLVERPDGNNVSLDREGLLLAETQMQFGLGVQLLQHEFHNLLLAINEGNKA